MKFCIITHVQHIKDNNNYYGYAPYIREMNIWLKYVDEVIVVAPLIENKLNPIYENYLHSKLTFNRVSEFNITSISNGIRTVFRLPLIFIVVYNAMSRADHIHLRCPGNMGLIGTLVQILFPNKIKTAKYAGNWDPKSKQPWSYRLQKWILSNTFLTKNMQVLVYGEWPNQTKNIKPFFTATYSESDKKEVKPRNLSGRIRFLFVGMLSEGKQPLYVARIIQQLISKGFEVQLDYYGDGKMREEVDRFCADNNLKERVFLQGNQSKDKVEVAYQESHFLLLPSKSEGWPKVVAEAMFWGCVPIVTPVSCVPYMIEYGKRGILLTNEIEEDVNIITSLLDRPEVFAKMSNEAQLWSREFTIDKFETEISKLLK